MSDSDLLAFSKMIASIGEMYGIALSSQLIEVYWRALLRLELEDINRALESHVNNPDCGQYFPKPADIVRFIEGTGETRALRAWAVVEHAMHQVGCYQSLAFDDALIHAVLEDMGGWAKLCSMTLDEMPFRASEFQKRYMGFVIKAPNRYPRYLWGVIECENAKNGYPVEPPLLVGDAKKAEQVMLGGGGTPLLVHESKTIQQVVEKLFHSANKNDDEVQDFENSNRRNDEYIFKLSQ